MEEKQIDNNSFKHLRHLLNLNQSEFAEKLGTHQQTIAMIENNKRGVPASIRENFYKVFGFSYDDGIRCNTEEQLAALQHQVFHTKNALEKAHFLKLDRMKQLENFIPIPYYSAKAAAGEGIEITNYPEQDVICFDKRFIQAVIGHSVNNLSLITAEGDSMSPTIKDGDLLMINDSMKDIIPNKIYVIRQEDKLRVKRLKTELTGETMILSDNSKYLPEVMDKETEIIGQVVWNGSVEVV